MSHPRQLLLGPQAGMHALPVCDHYSGVPSRMRKSLQLQAQFTQEMGACVFDVTLDCEDGAAVGAELEQARTVTALLHEFQTSSANPVEKARIGVRLPAVDHPAFATDVQTIVGEAAAQLAFIMLPKIESRAQLDAALTHIDVQAGDIRLPIHVLIESPAALHQVFDIAAHPRVQSISFGLMDFVSAHGGAIPACAMALGGPGVALDQFHHPLVLRAKMEIASACHAHGKVPSHCVVTEFNDAQAMRAAAERAAHALGYTRMWSIHPAQIRPILEAMSPKASEIDVATEIVLAAQAADWAPISHRGQLHDRASYRFFWQVLERAHRTGRHLPAEIHRFFKD
jgi:citrate lyase subunit beta/citryl-CoA lyase